MEKNLTIHNSTAEFLIFQLENWPKIQFVGNSDRLPQTGRTTT